MGTGAVIPILAVAGTHGWDGSSAGQWYDPATGPLMTYWRANGFTPRVGEDGDGFCWPTVVDGVGFGNRLRVWKASAENLIDWCVPAIARDRRIPGCELHIAAHSHGLQPVLIACAGGLQVNVLISFGSPARADVLKAYGKAARPNIGHWVHVYHDGFDFWQAIGEAFDGNVGIERQQLLADINWKVPGVGHTGALADPRWFPRVWPQLFDTIKDRHGRPDYLARA